MRRERGRVQKSRDRLLTTTLYHVASRPEVVDPIGAFLDLEPGQRAVLGRILGRVRAVKSAEEAGSQAEDLLGGTSSREREALVDALPRVLALSGPAEGGTRKGGEQGDAAPPAPPVIPASELPVFLDLLRRHVARAPFVVEPSLWSPERFLWQVATDDAYPRVEMGDLLLVDPLRPARENDLVAWHDGGEDRLGLYHRRDAEVLLRSPRPDVPPRRVPAAEFRPAGTILWLFRPLC
jgi:hypothetical protein